MMKIRSALGVFAVTIAVAFASAQYLATSEAEMEAAYKTDIEALSRLINLDKKPISAKWEAQGIGAGSDWVLLAEIELGEMDFKEVTNALVSTPDRNGSLQITAPPSWLDTKEYAGLTENTEGVVTVVQGSHSADVFASTPLLEGFVVVNDRSQKMIVYLWTN